MSLTKLKKKTKDLVEKKKQIPWKEEYFNVCTPDKVAETVNCGDYKIIS